MTIFTVTNTNDSGAGSLRQAILDSNAAGGSNMIEFDAALMGQTITVLSELPVTASAILDADVTIATTQDIRLFTLGSNGISVTSSADLNVDIDDAQGVASTRNVIRVDADDATFTNTGSINTAGVEGTSGDGTQIFDVEAGNFTLNNLGADASVITAGRSVIESFVFDDVTFGFRDVFTTVLNEGLLQATDDTVRLINGSVTNSGTIETLGTFSFGGRSEAGASADAILFFGPQSDSFSGGPNLVDNLETGVIEGVRSAISFSGSSTLNNDGVISGGAIGVLTQVTLTVGAGEVLSRSADLIINNSGTISREGLGFSSDFEGGVGNATISVGEFDSAVITNSDTGLISSTDLAIFARAGVTLNNEVGATIISNSDGIDADGIGLDGVAFQGATQADFLVEAATFERFLSVSDVLENA